MNYPAPPHVPGRALAARLPRRFFISVATVSLAASVFAAPSQNTVTIVSAQDLNVPQLSTAAISADGKRAYIGRSWSYAGERLNLLVATLGEDGKMIGKARRYRDSSLPLPEKTQSGVQVLRLDSRWRKLYVAYGLSAAKPAGENKLLSVYDLNEHGEPIGTPRTYECGNPYNSIMDMAFHPRLPLLYMVGQGGGGVYVFRLDDHGEPEGTPRAIPISGIGKHEIAISPDCKRMYLGTAPEAVEIVELDKTGIPSGKPRSWKVSDEKIYFRFTLGEKALFFKRNTPAGQRLAVWPLGTDGYPKGEFKMAVTIPAGAIALPGDDARADTLWLAQDENFLDAFSGQPVADGLNVAQANITEDGVNNIYRRSPMRARHKGIAIAANGNGQAIVVADQLPRGVIGNRLKDWRLRVTLEEATLQTPAAPAPNYVLSVQIGKNIQQVVLPKPGESSAWLDLNAALKDLGDLQVGRVNVARAPLSHLKMKIELAQGSSSTEITPLKTLTETLHGNAVLFVVPGYGFAGAPVGGAGPGQKEQGTMDKAQLGLERIAAFELFSDFSKRYLAAAEAAKIVEKDRPRLFPISASTATGGQGHAGQLENYAKALGAMGFNTVASYGWGTIPPSDVEAVFDKNGIPHRMLAVYAPPSYFAYDKEKMSAPALDKWASDFINKSLESRGYTKEDVVDFKMADEPAWYFPGIIENLKNSAAGLEDFRAYLKAQGVQPSDVSATDWSNVFPIGASSAKDLPGRRLFYHTVRYFPDAAARGFKLSRQAIERALGHAVKADVNQNNWGNSIYNASLNMKIGNNPNTGADAAMGFPDFFTSARYGAHTLWTEDWFRDQLAQTWSFYGDLLRSAIMLAPDGDKEEFGSYIIAGYSGGNPDGASYKALSLLGHGAKSLDFYTFGPGLLFPGNGWGEAWKSYRPNAEAIARIGRAERLLFPGKPLRGRIAIHMPTGSTMWNAGAGQSHYLQEMWGLHHALVHAGYTIDFVDDVDLQNNALAQRGYTVLYLLGPNVATKAQVAVREWVRGGGTLVTTPGATVADEYDTATDTLNEVLGLASRKAMRDIAPAPSESLPETGLLVAGDQRFNSGEISLRGPTSALPVTTAKALVTYKNGDAAITASMFGKGRTIAYGFFPGWQYFVSPDRSDWSRLPLGWDVSLRKLAVAPAVIAKTPRPVLVSREGVEACLLQSEKGLAVVLLNWTDEPIENLSVTIPGGAKWKKVSSIENSAMKTTRENDDLKIAMPLKSVDVLMIEL